MKERPQPSANDGPLDVLVATEPHEEPSIGPLSRVLLRHRRLTIALLAIASGLLLLFAWTLANSAEKRGGVMGIALGDSSLGVPFFDIRGRSGSHRIDGAGSSGRGSHYTGGASSGRSHARTSRSYGMPSFTPPRASTLRATTGASARSAGQRVTRAAGATRDSKGRIKRDPAARAAFQRSHPCPSNGKRSGGCPGYVVDHITPLKRGGADRPSNMQWQTTQAAKAKDRTE